MSLYYSRHVQVHVIYTGYPRVHVVLPDNKTYGEMADDFADFFIVKIQTIRDELSSANEFKPQVSNIPQLNQFPPLKIEEIQKEIMSMKNKSCELDDVPTNMLKNYYHLVLEQ